MFRYDNLSENNFIKYYEIHLKYFISSVMLKSFFFKEQKPINVNFCKTVKIF